ncbi:NAD(P)H-binding protein [Paractinoplanes brasiliensis]|uniref:Uncharacterized protein YbjT (DUF2867 family) n=1 Tax=Paractinoplanes brasiliensis TaxID=52695 RepID=A0A4R6JBJ5_9ACTN|nr:NAD(P)H-binding protein [Actinoplanes brasiliensis]TDO31885.1 uncharacterized protein YbjT (DUF2867 family) [Actinoplanes brasiliensis]GID27928.1 NmrA family transcriptional regulator [Actinoplanes brasiliensis]
MIVITGATGKLGSRIVDLVLTRLPADEVAVSVRDVSKAEPLAVRGVRVRQGDFTDPGSLAHAFEGAGQVLVISAAIAGPAAVQANKAAIDAARDAGAGRILYTSHQAASHTSLFAPQLTHAATEDYLATTGVPFTALRNGFYAGTIGYYLASAQDRLVVPEDGPFSWTTHDDLAAVAATALVDGVLDGVSPPLTAPELLDFADIAKIAGLTHVTVGDDEWKAAAVRGGMPEAAAEFTLGMFRAARRGEFAVTDPTLEQVLGRPATPARTVIESR